MTSPPEAMRTNRRFTRAGADSRHTRYVADGDGTLYAPASATEGTIARLDPAFRARAAVEDLCSACGEPFGKRARVFVQDCGAEPPLHAGCAAYALQACPHLAAHVIGVHVASETNIVREDTEDPENEKSNFAPGGTIVTADKKWIVKYGAAVNDMPARAALQAIRRCDFDEMTPQA